MTSYLVPRLIQLTLFLSLSSCLSFTVSASPLPTKPKRPQRATLHAPPARSRFTPASLEKYLHSDPAYGFGLDVVHIYWVAYFSAVQFAHGIFGAVGEIGVHKGRFFQALAGFSRPQEPTVALDLFESLQVQNYDASGAGNLLTFESNMRGLNLHWGGTMLQVNSLRIEAQELLDKAFRADGIVGPGELRVRRRERLEERIREQVADSQDPLDEEELRARIKRAEAETVMRNLLANSEDGSSLPGEHDDFGSNVRPTLGSRRLYERFDGRADAAVRMVDLREKYRENASLLSERAADRRSSSSSGSQKEPERGPEPAGGDVVVSEEGAAASASGSSSTPSSSGEEGPSPSSSSTPSSSEDEGSSSTPSSSEEEGPSPQTREDLPNTDRFFEQHGIPRFRLISIDGGHARHTAYNDLVLARETIADGGIVILDDFGTFPWLGVFAAVYDFVRDYPADPDGHRLGTRSSYAASPLPARGKRGSRRRPSFTLVPFLWTENKLYFTTSNYYSFYFNYLERITLCYGDHMLQRRISLGRPVCMPLTMGGSKHIGFSVCAYLRWQEVSLEIQDSFAKREARGELSDEEYLREINKPNMAWAKHGAVSLGETALETTETSGSLGRGESGEKPSGGEGAPVQEEDSDSAVSMLSPNSALLKDGTVVSTGAVWTWGEIGGEGTNSSVVGREDFELTRSKLMVRMGADPRENDHQSDIGPAGADPRENDHQSDPRENDHQSEPGGPAGAGEQGAGGRAAGRRSPTATVLDSHDDDGVGEDPELFPQDVRAPPLLPELISKRNRFNTTAFGEGVLDTLCEFDVDPQKWIRRARWTDSKYLWYTDANERHALTEFRRAARSSPSVALLVDRDKYVYDPVWMAGNLRNYIDQGCKLEVQFRGDSTEFDGKFHCGVGAREGGAIPPTVGEGG